MRLIRAYNSLRLLLRSRNGERIGNADGLGLLFSEFLMNLAAFPEPFSEKATPEALIFDLVADGGPLPCHRDAEE